LLDLANECIAKYAPNRIVAQEVILEIDELPCTLNGFKPYLEGITPFQVQTDIVSFDSGASYSPLDLPPRPPL
jgi:hypothetical protein